MWYLSVFKTSAKKCHQNIDKNIPKLDSCVNGLILLLVLIIRYTSLFFRLSMLMTTQTDGDQCYKDGDHETTCAI